MEDLILQKRSLAYCKECKTIYISNLPCPLCLQRQNKKLTEAIQHWQLCLDAAYGEGLGTVLRDSNDERLKDLIERRLLYDTEAVFEQALKGE